MNDFLKRNVETDITVSGNAEQACPIFPGRLNRYHWPFLDPAPAPGTEEAQMTAFREVHDQIYREFEAYAACRIDQSKVK